MCNRDLLNRRELLAALSAISLTSCAGQKAQTIFPPAPRPLSSPPPFRLPAVQAELDRIFRITVCSRPFRAAGPGLDVERVGEKNVVHNYGHGGSGWSLSWGSSSIAVEKAMSTGEREVAVIGCGALGLTSAILLQCAGAKVTIDAKDRPPDVRSSRATGSWTPDSRVALSSSVTPEFPALWDEGQTPRSSPEGGLPFAKYMNRIHDITPKCSDLAPGSPSTSPPTPVNSPTNFS